MKYFKYKIICLLMMLLLIPLLCTAYLIQRTDRVNVSVKANISFNENTKEFNYSYTVISHKDSKLGIRSILIEFDGQDPMIQTPDNWRGTIGSINNRTPYNMRRVHWFGLSTIKPNNEQRGLTMKSKGLPSIVTFYASGHVRNITDPEIIELRKKFRKQSNAALQKGNKKEADRLKSLSETIEDEEPSNAEEILRELKDESLKKNDLKEANRLQKKIDTYKRPMKKYPEMPSVYDNSFKGKTLGPVDPPDPFEPAGFINNLTEQVDEATELGWISDTNAANEIKNRLYNAKKKIGKDNPAAITTLDALLTDLETQHGTSVNDEAYFLIKYNALYLKERL